MFDEKTNNNLFKNFYANLALNLINKPPHAPNKCDLHSVVFAYYKRFLNTENQKFTFSPTSEDEILKLLTDTNPGKLLYKKGSKTDPQNYRPVSLLPLVSKVIAKVIHNQTEIF